MAAQVSLVIPTYNRADYLPIAIESVLRQTYPHFELVVWDDGSTDNSLEIARRYEAWDSRVRVVTAINQGPAGAINAAVRQSNGLYLGILDSDDWLAPTALQQTVTALETHPQVGWVYTDYLDVDAAGQVLGYGHRCRIPYSRERLLVDFMTFHFRLLRRSLFDLVGGLDPSVTTAWDYDLCLRLSEVAAVERVRQPLYFYRHHQASITGARRLDLTLAAQRAVAKALQRRGLAQSHAIELELPSGRFTLRRQAGNHLLVKLASIAAMVPLVGAIASRPAFAQAIAPAADGTGTVVTPQGSQFTITGGTQAGANLFHSFQRFGLSQGQTAQFLANPQIQAILGRVTGGEASVINGLIQVSGGNASLFLMNPAGIIFGSSASLNVPASFLATTATGIGFGDRSFNAIGSNDYARLVGTPTSFAFGTAFPGAIVNAGTLAVSPGQSLTLLGGLVINTGTLTAPGGQITLAAVPGQSFVRLQQPGSFLSFELAPLAAATASLAPLSLPELLTGGNLRNATGLIVSADGTVQLVGGSPAIPTTAATTIASGRLDTTGAIGGTVQVLGTQVGLLSATVDATGSNKGGQVLIGGGFQGQGVVPNASQTLVDRTSIIQANATTQGTGGTIIVWADQSTQFRGTATARGGSQSGTGGLIEISGKEKLGFSGQVDVSAPAGKSGTVLFDPRDIILVAGVGPDDTQITDGTVLFADGGGVDFTIGIGTGTSGLTGVGGTILLQATRNIIVTAPVTFTGGSTASITFQAGGTFNSSGQTLNLGDRPLTITAAGNITTGDIITSSGFGGTAGAVTLTSTTGSITTGQINTSEVSTFANAVSGSVTLNAARDIVVDSINTQATGNAGFGYAATGGDVSLITTGAGAIRLAGTFVDAAGRNASIATGATAGSTNTPGTIQITHGGGLDNDPFVVGDSSLNGSAGVIAIGTGYVDSGASFPVLPAGGASPGTPVGITIASVNQAPTLTANNSFSTPQDTAIAISFTDLAPIFADGDGDNVQLQVISIEPGATLTIDGTPVVPGLTNINPADSVIYTPPPGSSGSRIGFTIAATDRVSQATQPIQIDVIGNVTPPPPSPGVSVNPCDLTSCEGNKGAAPPEVAIPDFQLEPDTPEGRFTRTYEAHLGIPETPIKTQQEKQKIAREIEQATGVRPAFVYVSFVPESLENVALDKGKQDKGKQIVPLNLNNDRPTDQLEVLIITAGSEVVRRRIPEATRSKVLALADRFRREVSDPRKTRSMEYLPMAQQLYQWIVTPVLADLQRQKIDSLVFLTDAGLRSLPVAALHDGEKFLIETYSVGNMPSISLTNTEYRDIEDFQMLGMGISESTQGQIPLPSVVLEVSSIVNRIWSGGALFLNRTATLENLKQSRQQQPFGIIHLATHADFQPGELGNSYIQLWEERLRLNQVRELGWNNPQVEMLVLSACATALGDQQAELGFGGMAVQTGVKTAVASLWYVSDAATTALMTAFYQRLQTAPIKAEALRQAQIALVKRQVYLENGELRGIDPNRGIPLPPASVIRDRDFSHPYYWASFTMIGNPW